ncbi:ABC transporter substrate-binding protein [Methylobacterium sp. Leaf456]|uniref:TRAP transporter substrate-binding protein n=1 Tax=Methylobacterium sp. Leaf456 TaxID=1736382 RepID=UPI000701D4B5|nr:TRAP transporter substrate-binding protein [Methylobacterium sp. Leaf456]KQT58480.1 ABC transporter substrate-binding protein [Methylobacterium sp. Leaf456]
MHPHPASEADGRAPNPGRRDLLKAGLGAALAGGSSLGLLRGARADSAVVRLKLGNDLPASHSVNRRLGEAIAAITAETQGRLVITLFPNNQLGGDPGMIAQLRAGALELATMPGTVLSTLIPATALTGVGFTFTGYEKVWPAIDGAVGDHVRERIAASGIVPFRAVWDNGFRQITSSTHPIRSPEDLRNFKIRLPTVALWVSMFHALGAAPTSIPLAEAYPALQTRVADGQENPLALINAAKFYEVQRYCSLTNHAWDGFWLLASGKVWARLPEGLRAVMAKHFDAAAFRQREDNAAATATLRATLEGRGLVFNGTDPIRFRQALAGTDFYVRARQRFGGEAWDLLERHVGAVG